MINLQAQGYKIIVSNILQSMVKSKLQIRENVNKRIGMCENLVLFVLSCKKDIYSFNTSPQGEKEKKNGMMDINLRYVAALGGGLTLRNLCTHFDFPRPLAEHSYQSYLKYLEEIFTHKKLKTKIALGMCKNGWALHYVVIKINDGVQFYLMAKVLAVRTLNRPNNRLYANSISVCYPQ